MRFIFRMILPAVLAVICVSAFAQDEAKATKAQKKAEKKQEQRIAEDRKADMKGKKRHYQLQDKKTRRKMKRHRRRVNKHYPSDRPNFFQRLFRKKYYYIYRPDPRPARLFASTDPEPAEDFDTA